MQTKYRSGFPAGEAFIFEFTSEAEARSFFACDVKAPIATLEKWGMQTAIARIAGSSDISIPLATLKLMADFKPMVQLFFADTSLPPSVLKAAIAKAEENDSRWGIVRMSDQLQVLMSSGMSGVLLAGVDIDSTTNWKRPEFWRLPQLQAFNQEWQRSLNEDSGNTMEYRYQIRKPNTLGSWEWYRSSYRLMRGEDGGLYQVCQFVDRN